MTEKVKSKPPVEVSEDEIANLVKEEIAIMADKIIREEIEKEIEDKVSGKKISSSRRTRIFQKVNDDVRKQVPELLNKIAKEQMKSSDNDDEERRVSREIQKDIVEKVKTIVHKSMEKAIADEIFELVKIDKLSRTPTVEPKLGLIGVRHGQVLMVFFFLAISYAQRSDLSVALVAWTNRTQANPYFQVKPWRFSWNLSIQATIFRVLLFLAFSQPFSVTCEVARLSVIRAQNAGVLEYNWDHSTVGLILSSFYWGYLFLQIPGGVLAEKFGPKLVMCYSMLLCSTASLFIPAALILGGWVGVYVLKVIQGIGQATFIPAVYVFVARWIPPNEKSRLFTPAFGGIEFWYMRSMFFGMQMGTVVGMPICGMLCAGAGGWPAAFYFSAIIGYVWSVVWIFVAANSPAMHRSISREEQLYIEGSFGFGEITVKGARKTIPWKPILMSKPFWAIMFAHFGHNWGFYTLIMELPVFISYVLHLNITMNSFLNSLSFLVGWILIVIFGFLASYLQQLRMCQLGTERKIWNTIAFYGGGLGYLVIAFVKTTDPVLMLLQVTIVLAASSAVYNGFFSNHADLSPNYVGITMALSNCFGNLSALGAPMFVAAIVTESENIDQWSIIFYTAGGIMIFCNTIFLCFGSGEIQEWNTPSDLHLQLEDDIPMTFGSRRRNRQPFFVSNVDLADITISGCSKEKRHRKSI